MLSRWRKIINQLENIPHLSIIPQPEMKNFTTWKVGGKALALVEVRNGGCLDEVISSCEREGIKWKILGRGSNVLVKDEGFPGVVIKLGGEFCELKREGNCIEGGAGAPLSHLVSFAREECLGGIEFLVGVPGTVGGAVRINAGCFGKEIGPLVKKVEIREENGNREWLNRDDLFFSYRYSNLKKEKIVILKAVFNLFPEEQEILEERIREFCYLRKEGQPLEWPSAGSVFLNPEGNSAARIIEEMGLKGLRLGRAQISSKHSNFIVNLGGAKSWEIEYLINWVQKEVYKNKGIWLEREVELWP
ncbi:MAG TPA: UDP-N-acetylmuramate dehydrogenase [Candidatus Atribacteria bacterium]|nr:UDP-N-acetylmuramate dehydrogenase [Candidatus Atribacteria bacterium]HQD32562.1 UDP-N-acetylmuramate dehydrogenase [Candidatus Atribacteria bacterium]